MIYSQAKKFDYTLLMQKLSEHENILMAFVFGSAKNGELTRPDSDIDIAVWTKELPNLDDRLFLLGLCQETLQFENVDLSILNTASTLLRFEALSGTKLVIKNTDFYADFFSETCRYYEDEIMLLKKIRKIWHDIHSREKYDT